MARDAFHGGQYVLKFQRMVERNRNQQEWNLFSTSKIRDIVPHVYTYQEIELNGRQVSVIVVDRACIVLGIITERFIRTPLVRANVNIVVQGYVKTVQLMVRAVLNDITTRDWHTGNIAFMDADNLICKLIDWEGHRQANAMESYAERMNSSMHCLARPHPIKRIEEETADVQLNIYYWQDAMKRLTDLLNKWWATWKTEHQRRDEHPTVTDIQVLENALVEEARCILQRGPPVVRRLHDFSSNAPVTTTASSTDIPGDASA